MAIANREFDASEQRKIYQVPVTSVLATGVTLQCMVVPDYGVVAAIRLAATGVSGTPTMQFNIQRFITGAGLTVIAGGFTALTVTAVGTSGLQSVVQAAAGSTLLQVIPGDEIIVTTGGSASAVLSMAVAIVLQNTADIANHFNAF